MPTQRERLCNHSSRSLVTACLVFFAIPLFGTSPSFAQAPCPNPPVPSISSTRIPSDVCVPAGFGGNPIAFFDDYSWNSFIAQVWPALSSRRGTPDTTKTVGDPGPRRFETYKNLSEIFHNDGSAPTAWNEFDAPAFNACSVTTGFGDMVLATFSKFSDLGQAGFGTLIGPLVPQNATYVRYLNQILNGNWYLRAKLPGSLTFQNGALDVKSSWYVMTSIPHPERYYRRSAWVLDPQTGKCSQTKVGLVGLHVVQKTPSRSQWIWSTFEQVDTVPPAQPGAPGNFAFNDGKGTAPPPSNPYPISPLIIPTPPANCERLCRLQGL